jgi:hypothetical protein
MIKLLSGLLLIAFLGGCTSTAPAKSKCFSYGRMRCKFTPINQLWASSYAAINP